MDRNTITVMSGQIVDFFDNDFRELYAVSEQVDLYREFNITKPILTTSIRKPKVEQIRPLPTSTSRFQVSVGDSKPIDLKVPAHKYHNPKYSLVFGNSMGLALSLQDLSTQRDSLVGGLNQRNDLRSDFLLNGRENGERVRPQSPSSLAKEEDGDGKGGLTNNPPVCLKKPLSSFRYFLRGRGANQGSETIEEGVVTPQNPSPTGKVSDANNAAGGNEMEDSFEILDKSDLVKPKSKKASKLPQRSMSMQTINTGDEDGVWSQHSVTVVCFIGKCVFYLIYFNYIRKLNQIQIHILTFSSKFYLAVSTLVNLHFIPRPNRKSDILIKILGYFMPFTGVLL